MAKATRKAGSTSNIFEVFIQNTTLTTGGGLTALVYNTSGLTCYYKRDVGTASVAVTLATISTLGTWETGGFKEVDASNMPGVYEFHPPDAALAAGAKSVVFLLKGAANMAQLALEIELTAVDNQSATAFVTSVAITSNVKTNQALANFEFMMTSSTTHAPATGATVTCTRSIDGGAFAAGALANVAEVAFGIYKVDFGAGDLNGKVVTLRATATGCDDTFATLVTAP